MDGTTRRAIKEAREMADNSGPVAGDERLLNALRRHVANYLFGKNDDGTDHDPNSVDNFINAFQPQPDKQCVELCDWLIQIGEQHDMYDFNVQREWFELYFRIKDYLKK